MRNKIDKMQKKILRSGDHRLTHR